MLWFLSVFPAFAEDPTFDGAATPPDKPVDAPETKLVGELGGSLASGNANFYTLNGLVQGSHKVRRNQGSVAGGVNIGGAKPLPVVTTTTGGATVATPPADPDQYVENVRRMFIDGRYDRFLSDRDSVYVLAGAFHDKFAGYDLRAHEQVGYSRYLVKTKQDQLRAEIGLDFAQENYFGKPDPNYQSVLAARVLLGVGHAFNDNVAVSDTFEVYENVIDFDDVRILNTAALTASLSGKLSVKVSHSLIFDNVPVDGFVPLDQTSMITLVVSFL